MTTPRLNPDDHPAITLPAARMLLVPSSAALGIGLLYFLVGLLARLPAVETRSAAAAGLGVALASLASTLAIRPWRPLPVVTAPFIVLLATLLFVAGTLAAGFLLHFPARLGTVHMWLCLVLAFWAGLFGLVRVYGSHMKRGATTPASPSPPPGTDAPSVSE